MKKNSTLSVLCLCLLGFMSLGADCDLDQKVCPEPDPSDLSTDDLLDELLDRGLGDLFGGDDED